MRNLPGTLARKIDLRAQMFRTLAPQLTMMFFPSLLVLMATTTNTQEFRFVPYGSTLSDNPTNRPTISCDGRVDLDGALSVWACLHPQQALAYETLLKEGAKVGDFGEWSSDNGVKLDCSIESFLGSNEEEAYRDVLEALPNLLKDIQETGGASYQDLWKDAFQAALDDWEAIQDKPSSLTRGPGKMVLLQEPGHQLSPYALHRGLVDSGLLQGLTHILRCLRENGATYRYCYEMPGYGWVKKLVDRPVIPAIDGSNLVQQLPEAWAPTGSLTGICHTTRAVKTPLEEIALLLHELDEGS